MRKIAKDALDIDTDEDLEEIFKSLIRAMVDAKELEIRS